VKFLVLALHAFERDTYSSRQSLQHLHVILGKSLLLPIHGNSSSEELARWDSSSANLIYGLDYRNDITQRIMDRNARHAFQTLGINAICGCDIAIHLASLFLFVQTASRGKKKNMLYI